MQYLLSGAKDGVQIAYDGLHPAWATTEADCNDRFHHASVPFVPVQAPAFHRRRILQITPHPGIDYGVFDLTGVDAVLHRMYHSATVPEPATAFAHRCKEAGVPCQVSMEERMGCGIGACLVCACALKAKDGETRYGHVCKDGPVFNAEEVEW